MDDVRRILYQHGKLLYPTLFALQRAVEEGDGQVLPLRKKARFSSKAATYLVLGDAFDARILHARDPGEREALEEFRAARSVQLREQAGAELSRQKEELELENLEKAKAEGNTADCGCCFTECALNRMVHCDGDIVHVGNPLSTYLHWMTSSMLTKCRTQWFCRDCARMMAETQIGLSRHNLDCMSTDGCSGGFDVRQRQVFLDAHSRTALDRIEAEAALREAGITDLETCPFCPFAMVGSFSNDSRISLQGRC